LTCGGCGRGGAGHNSSRPSRNTGATCCVTVPASGAGAAQSAPSANVPKTPLIIHASRRRPDTVPRWVHAQRGPRAGAHGGDFSLEDAAANQRRRSRAATSWRRPASGAGRLARSDPSGGQISDRARGHPQGVLRRPGGRRCLHEAGMRRRTTRSYVGRLCVGTAWLVPRPATGASASARRALGTRSARLWLSPSPACSRLPHWDTRGGLHAGCRGTSRASGAIRGQHWWGHANVRPATGAAWVEPPQLTILQRGQQLPGCETLVWKGLVGASQVSYLLHTVCLHTVSQEVLTQQQASFPSSTS